MFFGNNAGLGQSKPMGQNEIWKQYSQRDVPLVPSPPLVVQDDSGRYRLGINDDDSPGFETRKFARDVWLHRQTRHLPWAVRT
jgi:hypothetical protein